VDPNATDYAKSTAIQYLPVTSAILSPSNGDTISTKDEYVLVKGLFLCYVHTVYYTNFLGKEYLMLSVV
jgi:hypothetical protein